MTTTASFEGNTTEFIDAAKRQGFGGSNEDINNRLDKSFNQSTNLHNDECSYVNQMRIMRQTQYLHHNGLLY